MVLIMHQSVSRADASNCDRDFDPWVLLYSQTFLHAFENQGGACDANTSFNSCLVAGNFGREMCHGAEDDAGIARSLDVDL